MSDDHRRRRGHTRGERVAPVLHVLFHAWDPQAPKSCHRLDGVDVVDFGRGPRASTREQSRLSLRLPDRMMSADHGRLARMNRQWVLEDPSSKNGAVIAGRASRCAPVRYGDLFELGHTLFLLSEEVVGDEGLDRSSEELGAASPELATFDAQFARQAADLVRVARSAVPVMLHGETGTGKEVFARALHALSRRRGGFVAVNCGGLAPQLVEAELFGHRRGAFSGAAEDRPGFVRAADGGTLFLDEIGDLPASAQAALLRVLQEREVVPVGDTTPVPVDFRLCAATHRDLAARVAAGEFRADLHARLLGATIALPPLRERRCDLGLLAARLLRLIPGGDGARFTPAAAYALLRYDWPLNVRELEHALAAAVARAGGSAVDIEHLAPEITAVAPVPVPFAEPHLRLDVPSPDDVTLRVMLLDSLTRHGGNVAAVARELGKHREQIHRWARRLGLDLTGFRR